LQSTATVGTPDWSGSRCGGEGEAPGDTSALLVGVLVIVRSRHGDLAPGVGAACGTHPMRPARAVALGTHVQGRRPDLVLGAPLRGPAVRLLFLGNRHLKATRLPVPGLATRA
jgi:hypothetical protein